MHCLSAWGQWAVQLLQCTASLPTLETYVKTNMFNIWGKN